MSESHDEYMLRVLGELRVAASTETLVEYMQKYASNTYQCAEWSKFFREVYDAYKAISALDDALYHLR